MKKYEWKYCSLGGAVRVNVASGEDIAHLEELDRKLWTVLSCPVDSLEFDKDTLALIDADKDGKIKVDEVIAAAQWLCSVIKDGDLLLKSEDHLAVEDIDESTPCGVSLKASAKRILESIGAADGTISVSQALDGKKVFAAMPLNGDGIVTPASTDDAALKSAIESCISTVGSRTDRSGAPGVGAEEIEQFYSALADYSAWREDSASDAAILPYGESTEAAYNACLALADKISDFYTRCHLLNYSSSAAAAVDVTVDSIDKISLCPIAVPDASCVLPADAVNPAWQAAFDRFRSLVPDAVQEGETGLSEDGWKRILAKFGPYKAWVSAKKGEVVESLGIARVRELLAEDGRQALLDLVEKDLALKAESDAIDDVRKLMLLYRDFYKFLCNYVIFTDFYSRAPGVRADFEVGRLFIDQRCCDLCVRVSDMSKHADMAKLSGMFLIYCTCTSKTLSATMDVVAVLTSGDIADLCPGKNGIFYDRCDNVWDAVVTKIVDNPISISQAFWAPYRKFWDFCVGLINKSATDKDAKITADLQAKASQAMTNPPAIGAAPAAEDGAGKKSAFDIAKFAGIFAALGMALGYIGSALSKIWAGIAGAPLWQTLVAIAVVMLVISGPSCFIAWSKLRKRNLGPILNANGWAINSKVIVNILFGNKLTSVAEYPKLKLYDPYRKDVPTWKKVLRWTAAVLVLLVVVFLVLLLAGKLAFLGQPLS